MPKNAPCKGCQDRELACHTTCERYAVYKAAKSEEHKQRRLYDQVISAIVVGRNRLKSTPPSGGNKRW